VLGQGFWETMQAKIDYERKEIHMGSVTMKFDKNNQDVMKGNSLCTIILEPRSETIVQLLTTSAERSAGILREMEVAPGVYVVESLTTVADGKCVCSVINVNNNEVAIRIAPVELEVMDDDAIDVKLLNDVRLVNTEDRIREVRKQVRLEHLSIRERSEILKICGSYNDVFYLPGDKLTSTHSVVHSIPTLGIVPCRGMASRNYRIPEALKDEVRKITEQMLDDGIIKHSTSPWNSHIILV
jgi:hypothetical protein